MIKLSNYGKSYICLSVGENDKLTKAAEGMSTTSDNLLRTSHTIQLEIMEIDRGVENLVKESGKCLYQMDMLSERISEVSNSSGHINTFAGEVDKVIETRKDSVI